MNKHISSVISTCYIKDIKIWEKVSQALPHCIEAESYKVIVPQNEVRIFRQITHPDIEVVSENEVLKNIDVYQTAAMLGSKKRAGWYYQQFLKIHSLATGNPDDVNLIWDADTLPLKKISFITDDGKLIYHVSDEYNQPYFLHIKKSLSVEKIIAASFIAQCFPARCSWVKSYISELEVHNNSHWINAIIDHIDRSELFGFSEYESMGTFFTHNFAEFISFSNSKWERFGNSKIGMKGISPELTRKLAKDFDYISFESWDVPDRMPELGPEKSLTGFLDVFFRNAKAHVIIQVGGATDSAISNAIQQCLKKSDTDNLTYVIVDASEGICNLLKTTYKNIKNIIVINAFCSTTMLKESINTERCIHLSDIRISSHNKNLLLIINTSHDNNALLKNVNWRFPPRYVILPSNACDATIAVRTLTSKGYKLLCEEAENSIFILSK